MIGMKSVKESIVEQILYYVQNFEHKNNNMLHTVIEGPPGVGKTELGKILSEIFSSMGAIKSNKFKVVRRTDLIGEYLGHTAQKTQNVINESSGGVLFIDEAYSLGNKDKRDSYAKECIDTLNQNLSENKGSMICIIAGYPNQLEECFFSFNSGLRRRFPFTHKIESYNNIEMSKIFINMVEKCYWNLDGNKNDFLEKFLRKIKIVSHFSVVILKTF